MLLSPYERCIHALLSIDGVCVSWHSTGECCFRSVTAVFAHLHERSMHNAGVANWHCSWQQDGDSRTPLLAHGPDLCICSIPCVCVCVCVGSAQSSLGGTSAACKLSNPHSWSHTAPSGVPRLAPNKHIIMQTRDVMRSKQVTHVQPPLTLKCVRGALEGHFPRK